jgi:hypothetical protein
MNGSAVEGPERPDGEIGVIRITVRYFAPKHACVGISRSRLVDQILHVSVGVSDGACLGLFCRPQKFWRILPI